MEKILEVFEGFRMKPGAQDQYETGGKDLLKSKIAPYFNAGQPIQFVMLGFPMKSPNDRDKVLGKLPDLGEELAMKNFTRFDSEIKKVYSPGVKINLVSDGYIFSDVLEVPDSVVADYEAGTRELSGPEVSWYNLSSFFSGGTNEENRGKVMRNFGIDGEELERRILFDPDVNELYRGMIKFMTGDLAIREFISNSQLHKAAKRTAREMMFRNEAYSRLVQSEFSDSVRLSMHQSINNGKFSFDLIPGGRAWTSPWHSAIVHDEQGYATIHKKDAAGLRLVNKDGRPYNYEQN